MMLPARPQGLGAASNPYASQMAAASAQYGIPASLLSAVAFRESGYNPNAVGTSGEIGLMQLMPATAAQLGVTNSYDPTQNINGGAKYLSQLYAQYGDWNLALEAYNEGPGALNAQLAAGTTPVSSGYASSILSAAGMSTDSTSSGDGTVDTSGDTVDSTDGTDTSGSMSGGTLAMIAVGMLALGYAITR